MIRKSTIFKSLTALVMSALSTTAVQAEVLVPLEQFLATTTRHYEANQYKTAYTVYVPQTELQGNMVVLNPSAVGEPVKLPITKQMVLLMLISSLIQQCLALVIQKLMVN